MRHQQAGRFAAAAAECRRALKADPRNPRALHLLGMLHYQAGDADTAARLVDEAAAADPANHVLFSDLGVVTLRLGRLSDAEAYCRRALSLKPDHAEALVNLGGVLWRQGRLQEAAASLEASVKLIPDSAEAHNNLGIVLQNLGRMEDARAALQRAIELNPGYTNAYSNLGATLRGMGRLPEATAAYRKALALQPQSPDANNHHAYHYSNLLTALQYDGDLPGEELLAEYRRFAARFEEPLKAQWTAHGNAREEGKRLKVGYVSPDFRRHAVAYFIEPVLANHDKSQVEVFCYYSHVQRDEVTERLQSYADVWVECKGLTDEQLAQRIREDGIDILVDLAGHTGHNRMLTFARKPAPVQIEYLGYPGTSGLSAMDYRLTDWLADPAGSEANYTEELLRLPDCLCCYRPEAQMPEVGPLPAQANGYVTFGSFNNYNKIDDLCLQLWSVILRAVPGAKLLMMTVPEGEARERLAQRFGELGVARERLEFLGKLPGADFHRAMGRADIALDPLAVTGGTTTCETLWMGVPVVVLVGAKYVTRVGYSFLSAAGLSEFAATSVQGYVELAVRLAQDVALLSELRAGLRTHVAGSALVDEARFARNLEATYRQVWARWCAGVT